MESDCLMSMGVSFGDDEYVLELDSDNNCKT